MNIQTSENEFATNDEAMIGKSLNFFSTRIFTYDVPNASVLNKTLLTEIYAERQRDQKGIQRSNFRRLGGWHSHNDLHTVDRFEPIVREIDQLSETVSRESGYHQNYSLKIGTMWSIVNPPGSSNKAHIHPGCLWSGVYYVRAPEGSGDIEFTDPRTENLIVQPKFMPNQKRPKPCWTKVNFTPEPGKMLIFPSWLYHSVAPNLSTAKGKDAERVIISFNLSQQRIKSPAT